MATAINVNTSNAVSLSYNAAGLIPAAVAVEATNGVTITPVADQKTLILISNAHATDAKAFTVKSGDGIQGIGDYTKSIAAGTEYAIILESGAFENIKDATYKGKIHITGASTDIKVRAIFLP